MSIHARTISKAYGGLSSHTERGLQLTEWSYPGASVESPGFRLEVNCKYSQLIIGSEVSITTYYLLMASALAQPDAQSPTAAAQQGDFWRCTFLRMGLAWKCLQLDKGDFVAADYRPIVTIIKCFRLNKVLLFRRY